MNPELFKLNLHRAGSFFDASTLYNPERQRHQLRLLCLGLPGNSKTVKVSTSAYVASCRIGLSYHLISSIDEIR